MPCIGLTVVVVLFYHRADLVRCLGQCPLTVLFMSDKDASPVDKLHTGHERLPEPVSDRAQSDARAQLDAHAQSDSQEQEQEQEQSPRPDPTRYGDWEKDGRCIDF